MLVNYKFRFINRLFFVNKLTSVFLAHKFLLFINIFSYSNIFFNPVLNLISKNRLNFCVFNSTFFKYIWKTIDIFKGISFCIYGDNLDFVREFLFNIKSNFPTFKPFALLFKRYFIFFNNFSLNLFLKFDLSKTYFFVFNILIFFGFKNVKTIMKHLNVSFSDFKVNNNFSNRVLFTK